MFVKDFFSVLLCDTDYVKVKRQKNVGRYFQEGAAHNDFTV